MDHKKFSTPLHQCLWDTEDLEIFILVVRKHGGHIPSKSKTEATWKNISEQMKIYASKKNIDSSTWSWKELYDAYKDMRKQLFKEYNIVETHFFKSDFDQLKKEMSKQTWKRLLLTMERERFQVYGTTPTDEARWKWSQKHSNSFYPFVYSSFFLCVADVVSIGFNSHGSLAFWVQIAILGMSILVFLFGFGMTIYYFPSDFDITKAKFYKRLRSVCFATSKNDSTSDSKNTLNIESLREASAKRSEISTSSYSGTVGNLIVVVCLCVDKECLFELTCYIIGIVYFSLTQSGLAALRVFRVYRYLDYFNYFQVEVENDVPKENLPFSLTIAAQRCGFYMEQLYYEFFTQKSLGGMLVMAIFFFNAYVMAVIMFNQRSYLTLSSDFVTQPCYNINMCFVTMFRLVVYDGTGLDFLSALLEEKSDGLVFMLFVYMIFNAIILINGMIGIFGNTFTENDETGVKTLLEIRDLDEKVDKANMDIDSVVREMTGNQQMLVSICNKLGIDSGPLLAGKEIKTAKKVPNRPKYRLSINVGSVKSSIRESGDSEASSSTSRCEVTDPSVQMSTHQTSANVVKLG